MRRKRRKILPRMLQRGGLRTKLLLLYCLLITIPLACFSLYTYVRVENVIRRQTLAATDNAFTDARISIEHAFGRTDGVLDILSGDPQVYAMASGNERTDSYSRRYANTDRLRTILRQLRDLSEVKSISLYVDSDYPYTNRLGEIRPLAIARDSLWYQQLREQKQRIWCTPADLGTISGDAGQASENAADNSVVAGSPSESDSVFASVQMIYDPDNVKKPLAILRADLDAEFLLAPLRGSTIGKTGRLLLLRGGQTVFSTGEAPAQADLSELSQTVRQIDSHEFRNYRIGRHDYFIRSERIGNADWHLAAILPYQAVFRLSHELRLEMFAVVLFVSSCAYLLAVLISRSTLQRLARLSNSMHKVESGDVAIRLHSDGNDEITQLMNGFNQMMDRLNRLMEEKVEYGRQIKNLELKALQAQINPHFLYNSLDLINCTAIWRNVPEISQMVNALSRFYRLSLSNGREIIPIRDEFDHARLYVEIQNLRFENRIHADWTLDPSAADCLIIKIILQPLIENAIIHGLFEKPDKGGHLSISIKRHAGEIHIDICDDGIGMDEPTRRAHFAPPLNDGRLSSTHGGYGVRNIIDRLHLAYGEPYGLECESQPGEGTRIHIQIPAIDSPPDAP